MKEPLQRSECKFCHYPVNLQIKHFTLSLHEPIQFPVTYSTAKVLLKSRDCSSSLLLLLRVSFFLIKVLVKQDIHSVFNFTGWRPARSQVCITAWGAKPNRSTLQMLSNCSPGKLVYVKASKQKNPANPVPIDRMYSFTRKKQVGGVRHQHVCRYLYQSNTHTHTQGHSHTPALLNNGIKTISWWHDFRDELWQKKTGGTDQYDCICFQTEAGSGRENRKEKMETTTSGLWIMFQRWQRTGLRGSDTV